MRSTRAFLLILLVTLCATPLAFSQTAYPYDPILDVGNHPLQSYHGAEIDSVNLATGNLSLHIPLISYPQRGGRFHLDYSIGYSSGALIQFHAPYNGPWDWQSPYLGSVGYYAPKTFNTIAIVNNNFPATEYIHTQTGTNTFYQQEFVYEGDGAVHPLGFLSSTQARSLDSSGFLVNFPTGGDVVILDPDGITTTYVPSSNTIVATDPNGNQMTAFTAGSFVGIEDTMGRKIPSYPTANTWTVPGYGGTVNFTFSGSANNQVITLPNLTSYTFEFTNMTLPLLYRQTTAQTYPVLTKVILPTGGSISYTYGPTPTQSPCATQTNYYFPVLSRSVDANDGNGPRTWTYSYNLSTGITTVTDPLGDIAVHTFGLGACIAPYETALQESDNGGHLLRTINTTYSDINGGDRYQLFNVLPTSVTTIWPNGQQQKMSYTYDRDNGHSFMFGLFNTQLGPQMNSTPAGYTDNQFTATATDYGSGAPGPTIRTTKTTYYAFTGPNAANYLANNLLSLPYTVQVSGSTQMSLTQYNYDESSLASSGLGASNQWNSAPPAGNFRGNNTSIYRWLNAGSLTCPNGHSGGTGTNLISKITFYDAGMKSTSADPCGNATTYLYSLNYWGGLPTTITNALNQSTTYIYDLNTGLITSTTDPNLLVTLYSYDNMSRLHQTTNPSGGVDTITRQESSFPFSATASKAINSQQNRVEINLFDGLGRLYQHQLSSDPQGADFTDTTYDALGRARSVSNPHRTCGSDITSSCGITLYAYDALDRKISTTYPDGSISSTAYCGSSTLVTDPTNRWRRSRVDGLGRMVEIDEPNAVGATVNANGCPAPGDPVWITSYTVDVEGKLTNVLQNGSRQRSFTYDSLSRLVCASNPETRTGTVVCPGFGAATFPAGTVAYSYNPDGTVNSKKDARGFSTAYTYDALHRELTRTYSNGDPTVTTIYDQQCTGCTNIGHRTAMTDGAGSETWQYQENSNNYFYNSRTIISSPANVTKSRGYWTDYMGHITSLQILNSGITRAYSYDSAGRPSTLFYSDYGFQLVGASTNPPTGCPTSGVCYTPQGTIYSKAITDSHQVDLNVISTYNNRLQPLEIKSFSTAGMALDLTYSFVDHNTGKNAGHLDSITNSLDSTRSQGFNYDQLNRLTSAQTTSTFATSPTHCWGENYGLDSWGNLQSISASAASGYTGCSVESGFSLTPTGNNQLTGFSYDASGNNTNDGTYTYNWDTESQLKSAGSASYLYDGDGNRVAKVGSKLYWYGPNGEILDETNSLGNELNEYFYFDGKRIEVWSWSSPNATYFYVEDLLGTSRVLTTDQGVVCYDADFYPYGGERTYTDTCPQNYKFEGKERDTETDNDDFGARYYSSRFGRWLSADYSDDPEPIPYADLTNPQTLNLYSMVANDPESFSDLDGHDALPGGQCHSVWCRISDWVHGALASPGTVPLPPGDSEAGVLWNAVASTYNFGAKLGYVLSGNPKTLNHQIPVFKAMRKSDAQSMSNMEMALLFVPELGEEEFATQLHHIATNKGTTYVSVFEDIFAEAGMTLEDSENLVRLRGHVGRHTNTYHEHVLATLRNAVRGKSGGAYEGALVRGLRQLRSELLQNPRLPYIK
jgi:RHS repeat-associated protein